ncbi:hypothetical protein BO94DRAFT_330622 [Aspergillus sclerotioniger CBS 115572]|uniref:Mediator complex subunit 27-domain-containing protein n=1 Tax=Aspergillus sclerotioniger CBS 115572 TaxID=1450535 RepID=A0A317UYX1_9EURO|nr:hypothetical protein BO94DRAFT_330622 [Aspergillus sclerotioniger CBS 115572]PWY66826.1 hypothetical protein BO94DRAFT_330622 [Aspergillus sclerotioniger CBS 115572]
MASAPNQGQRLPRMPVVVPNMTDSSNDPKLTAGGANSMNGNVNGSVNDTNPDVWDTEMQLVSSLAKLQKMEAMIHRLRTLLPERLLEPLAPLVNPKAAAGRPAPKSPQMLYEQLAQASRAGVSEVQEFQSMWRSPEMKAVWDRIDAQIKENGGRMLQPTGKWERDYDMILAELRKEEQIQNEQQQRANEELERSKIQATEGGWRAIAEGFTQKNVPGVRVVPSHNESSVTVVLVKAGMAFKVDAIAGQDGNGVPDWRVSARTQHGQPPSKLETAVVHCLNSRPRQWDLYYLLDMMSSYSNIKQAPCLKCNKMTDNAATLPTIRKPSSVPQQATPIWEPYHPTCIA